MAEESPSPPSPSRRVGPSTWRDRLARRQGGAETVKPRQRKALFLAGIILALVGVLVALLLWLRPVPRPQFAAFVIDEYSDARIPPVAWAEQDRKALDSLGWGGKNTFTSQARNLLVRELNNLGKTMSSSTPLVIYLRAYAAVTEDGVVALLPADARLDDSSTWLPVTDVLDILHECKVPRRLLILDLAQSWLDPRFGVLGHEIAERLQPLLQTAVGKDENLQILCACSPGQVSLASEEMGQSVFVYYLMRGLLGKADGIRPNTRPDGIITVRELADYVTTQVDRWAWNNRGIRQTPVFINPREDFPLTAIDKDRSPSTAPLGAEYPEELSRGWKMRDDWWNAVPRTPPEVYRQLEAALLRAEGEWRGGRPLERVAEKLNGVISELEGKRRTATGPEREKPHTLGEELARRGGKEPDILSPSEARRALKRLSELKASSKTNDKDAAQLKAEVDKLHKKFEGKPFELAWTIFYVASHEERPEQADLQLWYDLLDLKDQRSPYDEIRLLQDLAEWKLPKPTDWPTEAVQAALELAGELGKVPDPIDAEFRPWVKEASSAARDNAEAGRTALFNPSAAVRAKAADMLASALVDVRRVTGRLRTLTDARRALDEALVLLPGYTAYLEVEPALEKDWESATRDTATLRGLLAKPPKEEGDTESALGRVRTTATVLRAGLNKLGEPLDPGRFGRLLEQSDRGGLDDSLKMRGLLRLPALKVGQRAKLWAAWHPLAVRLHEQTLERETKPGPVGDQPPGLDLNKGLREMAERGLLRARISLALLRLAEAQRADNVAEALRKASQDRDPRSWQTLANELRLAWKPLLEK
jgi:hypothetical protein